MKIILTLLLTSILFSCTSKKKPDGSVIRLTNGTIEIGILPNAGGILVYASLAGQANILNSDSSLWNESPEKRPSLDPTAPFKTYNGHTTWLSPQSEWWTRQDSFPDLKKNRSLWPPDPILTVAPYQVMRQKLYEITLMSPESPFTKIQFTKIYRLEGNLIFLTTKAKNISNDTINWGLWHNTRMNGWDAVFVKADSSALRKCSHYNQQGIQKPSLIYRNGFFSYETVQPDRSQTAFKSKSFFEVGEPLIAGHHQNQWLIIRSKAIDPGLVHPEQARIELYIENSATPANDLQELEMQFAYEKIVPGASIEASETWEILPGSTLTDKKALLEDLKEQLK